MKSKIGWVFGLPLALGGAVIVNAFGFVFIGWDLLQPEPSLGDYLKYAGYALLLGAVGAMPGIVIGMLVQWANRPIVLPEAPGVPKLAPGPDQDHVPRNRLRTRGQEQEGLQ